MAELDHFALLTIARRHFHNAFIVHLTTNNPCHLSLYFTRQTPLRHKVTRIIRGSGYPWGAYFCFVGWQIVPQWEAGDTLEHTFLVYGLAFKDKLWYTFRGTVGGFLSPSSGPIIDHVHPHQDIIINSTFEEWSDPLKAPDYWTGIAPPGVALDFSPSTDRPLPMWVTVRAGVHILSAFLHFRQFLNTDYLSNLPVSVQCHYKGVGHWYDFLRVLSIGDDTRIEFARPTLPDIWQSLTAQMTLSNNLNTLEIRMQNTDHMLPVPKDVLWWYPDIFYGYVW